MVSMRLFHAERLWYHDHATIAISVDPMAGLYPHYPAHAFVIIQIST
jgi:hypothetical protein